MSFQSANPAAVTEPSPSQVFKPDRRQQQEIDQRRTFGIISHPDAGKDDAYREAPPLRRGDPARRRRQGPQGRPPRDERLDGDREGAGDLRHDLGDEVPLPGLRDQPPGHPRPPGLLRGHLPGPHRRGQRADGDRQRQGGRAPDREAHGGLPDAQHPDHDLHQQARPGRDGADGDPRRHRGQAPDRMRPALLADRHGEGLQGGLQPLPQIAPPLHAGDRTAGRRRGSRSPISRIPGWTSCWEARRSSSGRRSP